MKQSKKKNELNEIYQEFLEKKQNGNEEIPDVKKLIYDKVSGDRNRFLKLKAQEQAFRENLDIKCHLSILAIVISIMMLWSNAASLLAVGRDGVELCLVQLVSVICAVIGLIDGVWVLFKIIGYMGKQEDYNYIGLCLEEYEKEYFSN